MITLGLGFVGGVLVTLGIQNKWDLKAIGAGVVVLVSTVAADLLGYVPTLFGT